MSNIGRDDFHKRLAAIDKKPQSENRAKRSTRVGLYDFEEEKRRKANRFPWRKLIATLILAAVGLIVIKTFMVRKMGEEQYQARLVELREGEGWMPYAAIVAGRDPLMMIIERMVFGEYQEPIEQENAPEPNSEASENTVQQ
tara:strand:+ start:2862 stop:3287 length:426 start_codon:yes stop_codon:yes gene_type:complete